MAKLSSRLADMTARCAGLSEEQKSVVAYGLGALCQALLLLAASAIFGAIFHCLFETMVIFWTVGLLKSAAGGAHARTSASCTVISLASIFLMALLARFVFPVVAALWWIYALTALGCFALAGGVFYRRVPVDCENKPIVRPEKIARLRRRSFAMLTAFFLAALALTFVGRDAPRFINASLALCLAALWQSFMLTKAAERMIAAVDSSIAS